MSGATTRSRRNTFGHNGEYQQTRKEALGTFLLESMSLDLTNHCEEALDSGSFAPVRKGYTQCMQDQQYRILLLTHTSHVVFGAHF